jgi:uncharacterized protein YndB with AHSA1/START domain
MLAYILVGLAAVVVLFLIIVAMRPGAFRIERSTVINAPPAAVFPHVNEFRKWEAWSPWQHRDPAMKQTYAGPPAGAGAITTWAGNRDVGEGRMTITESRPNELIRIKLEFLKPFKATNTTEFTFKPGANGTTVVWAMSGTNNFLSKAFCLFMNMDRMVGGDFEKGLAGMKAVAEAGAR